MEPTRLAVRRIRKGLGRAPTACLAAAVGTSSRSSHVAPGATSTTRASPTASSVSGLFWPQVSHEQNGQRSCPEQACWSEGRTETASGVAA